MRILLFTPNPNGCGAARVAVKIANGFAQRGYAVDMVLLSASGVFPTDFQPEIRVVDLHVKRLRSAVLPLMRYLRQVKPIALRACMWPLTVLALWARASLCARARGGGGTYRLGARQNFQHAVGALESAQHHASYIP